MKRITTLLIIALFTLTSLAQDKINWLTTSEFEKAVKEEKQSCFIFIQESLMNKNIPTERAEERKKQMYGFLKDKEFIKYVNQNFICYKFNTSTESISFKGKIYNLIDENGRKTHEFTSFLTGMERNRLPVIVLKDKKHQFFEYKKVPANLREKQVLFDAEKLRSDYITKKLGADNRNTIQAQQMLKRHTKGLQDAKQNKQSKSVLQVRKNPKRLIKTLTYFVSGSYKKIDLDSFIKAK